MAHSLVYVKSRKTDPTKIDRLFYCWPNDKRTHAVYLNGNLKNIHQLLKMLTACLHILSNTNTNTSAKIRHGRSHYEYSSRFQWS